MSWLKHSFLHVPLFVSFSTLAGLIMLPFAVFAMLKGEHHTGRAFLYSGLFILFFSGLLGIALVNRPLSRQHERRQFIVFASAYLWLPLLFAFPFAQSLWPHKGLEHGLGAAWFEMVSCFTTTGFATLPRFGMINETLHLWRASVGWVGGLFILTGVGAIMSPMNFGGIELLSGQYRELKSHAQNRFYKLEEPSQRFQQTLLTILPFYGGLTLSLWILLFFAGNNGLDSMIYAMSTLSTSGIAPETNLPVVRVGWLGEVILMMFFIMLLTYRYTPGIRLRVVSPPLHRDPEMVLAVVLVGTATVSFMWQYWQLPISWHAPVLRNALSTLWGAFFTSMSFLNTTGFVSAHWPTDIAWRGLSSHGIVLASLAIIGGGAATTAGGVKLLRLYILLRHGKRELERLIHPSSLGNARDESRWLRRSGAYYAWIFFMLFVISIANICMILSFLGMPFEIALATTLASITTTGPVIEIMSNGAMTGAFLADGAPHIGKLRVVLAVAMVIGRIEMMALLILLAPSRWAR